MRAWGINIFTANAEISSLFIHIYQKSTFFQTYQNINICFQVMSECNVLNHILSLYLLQGVANFSSRYPQHFYIFCNMLKAGENNNFIVESSPKCLNSKFRSWKIFSSKKLELRPSIASLEIWLRSLENSPARPRSRSKCSKKKLLDFCSDR